MKPFRNGFIARVLVFGLAAVFLLVVGGTPTPAQEPPECLRGAKPLLNDFGIFDDVQNGIEEVERVLDEKAVSEGIDLLPDEVKEGIEKFKGALGTAKKPITEAKKYADVINELAIAHYAVQCLDSDELRPNTYTFAFAMGQLARSFGELGKKFVKVPKHAEFAKDWMFEFFIQMEDFYVNMHKQMSWCLRYQDFCASQCAETGNFCEYRSMLECTDVPADCEPLMALARTDAEKEVEEAEKVDPHILQADVGIEISGLIAPLSRRMKVPRSTIRAARQTAIDGYGPLIQVAADYRSGELISEARSLLFGSSEWESAVCAAGDGLAEAAEQLEHQVSFVRHLDRLQKIHKCPRYWEQYRRMSPAIFTIIDRRTKIAGIEAVRMLPRGNPSSFAEVEIKVDRKSDRTTVGLRAEVGDRRACGTGTLLFQKTENDPTRSNRVVVISEQESAGREALRTQRPRYLCASIRFELESSEPDDCECVEISSAR